jgi:hypothetical protein
LVGEAVRRVGVVGAFLYDVNFHVRLISRGSQRVFVDESMKSAENQEYTAGMFCVCVCVCVCVGGGGVVLVRLTSPAPV